MNKAKSIKPPLTLSVRDMQVWLGKKEIVKQVSFRIPSGLVGLLGNNGSGKTTLMKGILNLGCHREGQVWAEQTVSGPDGRDRTNRILLSEMSGRQQAGYLAYAPQDSLAVPGCSVLDFVVMGRTPYLGFFHNPGAKDYEKAKAALKELGIAGLQNASLDRLSGGERKMAYLARARVQGAAWMLLDEPAAGLDYGRAYRFFQELREYVHTASTGALVSIHDPLLAYTFCDQLLFLEEGKLCAHLSRSEENFEEWFLEQISRQTGLKARLLGAECGKTIGWML